MVMNWFNKEEEQILMELTLPEPPKVAMIEKQPLTPDRELIARALEVANQQDRDRQVLVIQLTETTLKLESANRQIREQDLTITQQMANLQNQQSQIEELRQAVSNLRAFFAEHRSTLDHLVKRFEYHDIPRKNAKVQELAREVLKKVDSNEPLPR
jgi:predicted O-linked N-acetylglucosamine transferase (SPINDLY family)